MSNHHHRKTQGADMPTPHDSYEEKVKVGEGTYGLVYSAKEREGERTRVALKQFKTIRQGEGIAPSAYREIALLRELQVNPHPNIIALRDIFLDPKDKSVWMVLDFAQHDLCRIVNHHAKTLRHDPPHPAMVKSIVWQLLRGVHHLHSNFIMHRDLKPANILLTSGGVIKVADFGLARLFHSPLRHLKDDGIVVTIWYRAPELLLNAENYTTGVDLWAVGCIFAELVTTKALFPGSEEKHVPVEQLQRIFSALGLPTHARCEPLTRLPGWRVVMEKLGHLRTCEMITDPFPNIRARLSPAGYDLLLRLLDCNPHTRITAEHALQHPFFHEEPLPMEHALSETGGVRYPTRVASRSPSKKPQSSTPPAKRKRV